MFYPRLTCNSVNDSFTKSSANGNGSLDNPVGLLTTDEGVLAGGRVASNNNNYYLYTNSVYWLMSPSLVYTGTYEIVMNSRGNLYYFFNVSNAFGFRPSVLLKPGGSWSGDGTAESPYQVSYS